MNIEIWTDGTSRPKMTNKKNKGKDGHSAGSMVIKSNDSVLLQESFYLGVIDNNQAEYCSFIKALKCAIDLNVEHVVFYTDSNLIEKQMNNKYSAHKDSIIPYYDEAKNLLQSLKSWEVVWIPRTENREADKLAYEFIKQWQLENITRDI
ncbi:gp171 [Bacillus phage G]|uniref:Gp171 n=1 Tax=Bacillus phage G TaxID=2884420 RepID=G3MBN7_9CAUD|nr:gp171 [Bacillus phage G]AEO93431.1 gp171 [Bacillus phage G]